MLWEVHIMSALFHAHDHALRGHMAQYATVCAFTLLHYAFNDN